MPSSPVVTVVVASRNRASLLPRLVAALEAQEGAPPFEVVISDDASTDDTAEVLARLAATSSIPLTVLRQPKRRGPGPGRNAGWRAGSGSLVAFTDDDCVPHPTWVAAIAAGLTDHDLVQGTTIPAPDQAANAGVLSRTLEVREATGFFETCNMGYRRTALAFADGFDERFDRPAGEDTDLALRCLAAGMAFSFLSDAVVEHDVRPSSLRLALKDTWRWQGVVYTVAKHPRLRQEFTYSRHFWKASHPRWLLAAGGLVAAGALGAVGHRRLAGLALGLVVPYLRHRLLVDPIAGRKADRLRYLGHVALVDGGEVLALAQGSRRYRTLFL